jgi:tetratricopeptide (TPR) repeat protein
MARYVLGLCVLVAAGTAVSGCSAAGPIVSVLRGNMAYGGGEYQTALVHYLSAGEESEHRGWLLYNTGNVYYALGEQEAALGAWDKARSVSLDSDGGVRGAPTVLIHAASYNRGVLLYQRGEYRAAYDEFRYALSLDSRSMASKQNLELALQKMRSAEQAQMGAGPVHGDADEDPGPTTLRILEYVRRKEAQRWHANRDVEGPSDSRDW